MVIVTDPKILKEKSKEIPTSPIPEGYFRLIKDLEVALAESERKGVGLSAIQIAVPLRVAIIRSNTLNLDLYNTKILEASEVIKFKDEGCLSVPNKYVDTYRMNKIKILNGDGKVYDLQGLAAIIVQHEMDHWDGITILDREIKDQGGI